MSEYHIRAANIEDVEEIAHVHVNSWHESYKDIIPHNYISSITIADRRKFWESNFKSTSNPTFVAEHSGNIIGFISGGQRGN